MKAKEGIFIEGDDDDNLEGNQRSPKKSPKKQKKFLDSDDD